MLRNMADPDRTVAIVLAAGVGGRLSAGRPKALVPIGGRPIIAVAVASATASAVGSVIVTAPPGFEDDVRAAAGSDVVVVTGGGSRLDSVRAALAAVGGGVEVAIVHDAARPFATAGLFDEVVGALKRERAGSRPADGAIPVIAVADTVKRVDGDRVMVTEPRERLVLAQTPQAFHLGALRESHERASAAGSSFTDDAAVLEWAGYTVCTVPGDPENFKITTPEDLARADARMAAVRG